ncbi:hypothetical protein TRFO_22222 [Tritrichomonas foetus]|uniref:Uncharacterized protein n=1 Tax=Tritrichomonas foetus TaxID=1144522 RepID=A0A1J4KCP6_9EUKA|nr:hypothetical protein TRFO_22222 [Tritrichomonas foetus]|eukprot:OHT08987.1 hypothetical protein TRFO_22222 [Tritrichomonas foetus]
MASKYLNRLSFIDKICFDRAYSEFKIKSDEDNDENTFLLSLLETSEDFEPTTVRNAINFARSWAELGRPLSQRVLTRILYLCFLEPKFLNQMMFVTDIIQTRGWIFHAVSKMIQSKYDLFIQSIKENHPVWEFLIDSMLSDAKSKEDYVNVKYLDRPSSFLAEVMPLYWPSEETMRIEISSLVNSFFKFLLSVKSRTALNILNIYCYIFPENVVKIAKDELYQLSSDGLFILLKNNFLKMPTVDVEHGAILAAKMLPFNPKAALSLAESDQKSPDKESIIEMIKNFNASDHTFTFQLEN